MSKRKLNRKQAWRVKKIQDERALRSSKRTDHIEQQLQEGALGEEQEGLMIANYGTQVDVEYALEAGAKSIIRCHFRANIESLVTGDRVVWREGKPTGVVVAVKDRQSELTRPNLQGQQRTIAANIDYIVIVLAPIPSPNSGVIDRYLVAAESVSIKPLILLNKFDLIDDKNRVEIEELLSVYPDLGYRVLNASSKSLDGLHELETVLKDRNSVFVGQSGVGKSSLINSLLADVDLKVGELSERDGEGMHTTTTARLFHLPKGGQLIDSPGIREFGLWHMERLKVFEGFIEFRPFLGKCKFRDCKHKNEPGCEILAAVERGEINATRLSSFHKIAQSLQEQ
jgi:ribosome biogenesis GTPase / thiamine phosphate phosphatase